VGDGTLSADGGRQPPASGGAPAICFPAFQTTVITMFLRPFLTTVTEVAAAAGLHGDGAAHLSAAPPRRRSSAFRVALRP